MKKWEYREFVDTEDSLKVVKVSITIRIPKAIYSFFFLQFKPDPMLNLVCSF